MLLYTEKQLKVAYTTYLQKLIGTNRQGIEIPFPTLEEFRLIYEDEWNQRYREMNDGV
jgi:hypothetical protein